MLIETGTHDLQRRPSSGSANKFPSATRGGGCHNGVVLDDTVVSRIPYVSIEDLTVEKLVGSGSFSCVYRVRFHNMMSQCKRSLRTLPTAESSLSDYTDPESESPSSTNPLDCNTPSYFALKKLSTKTLKSDEESIDVASKDLAYEAAMLLKLPPHENIITLHALSTNFWHDITRGGFLIIDKLSETLDSRLCRWRKDRVAQTTAPPFAIPFLTGYQRRYLQEQEDRITMIGLPVARAMSFLHSHNVCYRDLKPANIGFDERTGQVRLFDFGLAREHHGEEDERILTGYTGSARYMAPEVMLCERYSTPADVYSYAIVLWELCTLRKPFKGVRNVSSFQSWILRGNARPALSCILNESTKETLQMAWHRDPNLRPSFTLILHQLGQLKSPRLHDK